MSSRGKRRGSCPWRRETFRESRGLTWLLTDSREVFRIDALEKRSTQTALSSLMSPQRLVLKKWNGYIWRTIDVLKGKKHPSRRENNSEIEIISAVRMEF
jgi:hypothetical protein